MDRIWNILQIKILGNTLQIYLIALFLFIGLSIALKFLERFVLARLQAAAHSKHGKLFEFITGVARKTLIPVAYVGAFYVAVSQLTLNPKLDKFIDGITIVALTIQITRLALEFTVFFVSEIWAKKQADMENVMIANSVLTIVRLGIWGFAAIFILDNLGFNVSAVVAGLGIGGVAVALAAQTILGDLFNYFVIFFDRPFVVGDSIDAGDLKGTVEEIGIKTTRLRSIGGEMIVMSNSDLTGSRVRNFKRMIERRSQFKIGVTYQTKTEVLEKIPGMIRAIIEKTPKTRVDRVHFQGFSDSSLDIEIVYYVLSADYNVYMDIQQEINLEIKRQFEKAGIEFAYPTQTVYDYCYTMPPEKS